MTDLCGAHALGFCSSWTSVESMARRLVHVEPVCMGFMPRGFVHLGSV